MKKSHIQRLALQDIALRLAVKLGEAQDLHVGYWDGLAVSPENLPQAQERFNEVVASHIPEGVRMILDVGCGTGHFAERLIARGYSVECLTPDPFQVSEVLKHLGNKVRIHQAYFEEFSGTPVYDLILMFESCHCINQRRGLERAATLLKPGGYLLIADFFRTRPVDNPYISKAGHKIQAFIDMARKTGLLQRKQVDVSHEISPTLDLWQGFINHKIFPLAEAVLSAFQIQFPYLYKILRLFLKKKVAFAGQKLLVQNRESIGKYKRYYILLFQKL